MELLEEECLCNIARRKKGGRKGEREDKQPLDLHKSPPELINAARLCDVVVAVNFLILSPPSSSSTLGM